MDNSVHWLLPVIVSWVLSLASNVPLWLNDMFKNKVNKKKITAKNTSIAYSNLEFMYEYFGSVDLMYDVAKLSAMSRILITSFVRINSKIPKDIEKINISEFELILATITKRDYDEMNKEKDVKKVLIVLKKLYFDLEIIENKYKYEFNDFTLKKLS